MIRSLLILILVFTLSACSKPELLTRLSDGSTVLAFGDSLTAGKGVGTDEAYPAKLAEIIGMTVVNAGISGETTKQGLQRLPKELESHSPDLVILFEGGNDILRGYDLAKTKRNLNAMINLIKQSGAEVVLVAVPPRSLFSAAAGFYTELAEEHELPLQKSIVSSLLKKSSMKSDSVHFNQAGYQAVAVAIKKLLEDHGAV
ncbi:MAG: GDSL-type esterase/lipase family protein [Granulosicoccaceae bacterium]